jgi:hypothetical protein
MAVGAGGAGVTRARGSRDMKAGRLIALAFVSLLAGLSLTGGLTAQAPEPAKGVTFPSISQADLKEWLTYLSSDELQGRQIFSEGYGVAAQYIADRLKQWGVKPLGDNGSYFQIVKLQSYRVVRNSTVTVEAGGRTTTFKDGEHVTFAANSGGKQSVTFTSPMVASRDGGDAASALAGKLVLGFPGLGGRGFSTNLAMDAGAAASIDYRAAPQPRTFAEEQLARAQAALAEANAAVLSAQEQVAAERGGAVVAGRGGRGRGAGAGITVDIAPTPLNIEHLLPPRLTGDDEFFTALFAGSPTPFADLKARLERGETPAAPLAGVKVTINVSNTYEPVTSQLSRNVVGMVEGTDARLKDTYVMFGAHLDHVGYALSSQDTRGQVNTPIARDRIWNGADDDGTGVTAEMAIAKAFATGPKPRRSIVFVWHGGEEEGMWGSRYAADFPVVPIEKVQAQLNIDMIGRNRDNDAAQANTLFVIGADRISTDLHNLIVATNATFPAPMKLDYEYNDQYDPNSFYTRSDHYSYASKGIPAAFFFTGTHPDYHANTDTVDKILFDKQARIAQLVYQIGFAIAASEQPLRRDARGPRTGRGSSGPLK